LVIQLNLTGAKGGRGSLADGSSSKIPRRDKHRGDEDGRGNEPHACRASPGDRERAELPGEEVEAGDINRCADRILKRRGDRLGGSGIDSHIAEGRDLLSVHSAGEHPIVSERHVDRVDLLHRARQNRVELVPEAAFDRTRPERAKRDRRKARGVEKTPIELVGRNLLGRELTHPGLR
jgi:hypothetical protein